MVCGSFILHFPGAAIVRGRQREYRPPGKQKPRLDAFRGLLGEMLVGRKGERGNNVCVCERGGGDVRPLCKSGPMKERGGGWRG